MFSVSGVFCSYLEVNPTYRIAKVGETVTILCKVRKIAIKLGLKLSRQYTHTIDINK